MAEDGGSHRRFRVYPVAGAGAGANDPDALTDEQADEAVPALTWPDFAEVRLWRPDMQTYREEFAKHATPFEHVNSSLIPGYDIPHQGDTGHPIIHDIPVVNDAGEVVMYVGWHDWRDVDVPTDIAQRFRPGMDLQELVNSHGFVSEDSKLAPGMAHPGHGETEYLLLTTIDGTIMEVFKSQGVANVETSSIQVGDILAIIAILRSLGAAALEELGRLGTRELEEQIPKEIPKLIRPVNGTVNVGGGGEIPNVTNLNPIKVGSGGPTKDIPNHVLGSMEDMAKLFEPASVKKMYSSRLRFGDVDWAKGTTAAAKVMPSGGEVGMNVWTFAPEQRVALKTAFEQAGFKNVRVMLEGAGTMVFATR